MEPFGRPRVKICCVASVGEAWLAVRCGASAVGLVSEMPSGPGVISEERIAEIARRVPPSVSSFLLTSRRDVLGIVEQQRRCGTGVVQLCDRLRPADYGRLREALPGVGLVQVVHVTGYEAVEEASEVAPLVNGILLDSGDRRLRVKVLGGTGRLHDWRVSRRIRELVDAPVFLAGGLCAENAGRALEAVQPFGVDVCNGVRTDGKLDEAKLKAFFRAVEAYSLRHE